MFEFGASEAVGPTDSTEVHLAFQMFRKWLEGRFKALCIWVRDLGSDPMAFGFTSTSWTDPICSSLSTGIQKHTARNTLSTILSRGKAFDGKNGSVS